ncbi:NRT2.5, partial [Symbiodinium microadriaticum]
VRESEEPQEDEKEKAGPAQTAAAEGLAPPPFASGDYILDSSGSGWWGHPSGDWLFNKSEGIYFHSASTKLFMEDPRAPGQFLPVGGDTADLGAPARLRGRIRWFSRSKGFGFVAPWPKSPDAPPGVSEDVFLHRSQLLPPEMDEGGAALPRLPLVPGAPVEFDLGMQDGKPSAVSAQQRLDLHGLCRAGFAGMSCTRQVEPAPINLKAESGHSLVGCFAGLVTGRHGMGGAEFVALNLAKDLGTSFQGREQGGRRGAKAAMLAGFQRTQHGFLQYAQRLSDNSAKLWLSAETSACCVLVFGPDKNGMAAAVLGDAGAGGRGLVVARDGQITSRLGAAGPSGEEKPAQDSLKVFEHGLKGPSINFPSMPGARGPAPKGFGTHAYSEKGGSAAGLAVTLDVCQLDWANDALIILASESFWAIADEEKAAKSALAAVVAHQSPEQALMQDVQAARRGAKADDLAITVLRFTWVDLTDGGKASDEVIPRPAKRRRKNPKARVVQEVDDIFAQPGDGEGQEVSEEDEEEEEDDSEEEARGAATSTECMNVGSGGEPEEEASMHEADPQPAAEDGASHVDAAPAPEVTHDAMDDIFSEFCTEIEKLH